VPELHWRYGYFAVLIGVSVICVGLFFGFKFAR
jgi:Mg2+ and Co2+ transporter CorA